MDRLNVEVAVGVFLVVGFLCFAWLSVKLGHVDLFGGNEYTIKANFSSVTGLKEGASVEIAGVKVGKVSRIRLCGETCEAEVELTLDKDVSLQDDSIASIRTTGIIGDRYVSISPGGNDMFIEPGGVLFEPSRPSISKS